MSPLVQVGVDKVKLSGIQAEEIFRKRSMFPERILNWRSKR